MRASSVRALAAGLAVMQAGTLVGQAPVSAYAAELEDLDTEEVESSEVEEGNEEEELAEEESSGAEESTEDEETNGAEEVAEESTEDEETNGAEESTEEETSGTEESTEEETSGTEESTEEETSAAEESTEEETSAAEESTEEEETGEAEESVEEDETLENDLAAPEETEPQAGNDTSTKAPAKVPMKAPAEAKVYKITVVDTVVDEEGNELGSEARFVDELEEGEEYSYSALDDESLTVVGEAEYTGICEGDLTIEFRYTSEDLNADLFANFSSYIYVTDEFYDTDDSLLASSSRKYGYDSSLYMPDVNALKNSDYTVTAVIVKTFADEYDVINGVNSPYSGTIYPYNQESGNLDVYSLSYAGINVNEVVFKYAAKSEVSADTVSLTVVDEFYDQDGTTLIERREREVKEVAANQMYSFSKLDDPGYDYYLMSDEVQTVNATENKEIVFKYAKYININVRHIYKDAAGNQTLGSDDSWSERVKYGQEYSIKSRPEYYGEAYEVEGDGTYTGTAISDLSLEFTYRKVDAATLDITYEYYDVEGGTLLYTSTDRVRVKKGSDYTPVATLYYDSWEYRPVSAGVSDVQADMSVTCTYVKKKKYTVTGVFKYYDKDEANLIRTDRKPREFYEGSDVVVDWDGTEYNYVLKTGDRNLTNLQADTEVELVFVEGQYTVTYHVTKLDVDGSVLSTYDTIRYCMAGGSSVVPDLPYDRDYDYEWTVEPQVVDNVQQNMEVSCECKRIARETVTITIIDRFLSADGKRVLFEYTRTEECAPSSSTHLKKPVKQGFIPSNVTDYISVVKPDMTIVNESVASDKDCTVKLQFEYRGRRYDFPSLTVKPGTLIVESDLAGLPGMLPSNDSASDFVSYNEGDEVLDRRGYYYVTGDMTICSTYMSGSGYDTYPLLVIDKYYNKSGDVVSEVARNFNSYRAGDSVTINAISGLSGYKPREASKTIIMNSSTDTLVLEYDECSTYTVTVKDKYYDTDGVTLIEEKTRPAETHNAGENVTVQSKYESLYTCAETSKTVTDIQADTEIEFVYVKKVQYTVDITHIYYEADGVTEIERQTSQEKVFAGDWCFFGGSKDGFYLGLDDDYIVPDKDTKIEVPFYKYSTITTVFHVLNSSGNQIDEVRSDLENLRNGVQTISVASPKYTSPSMCEREVDVVNGMEVSFDVTAVPTEVTVTDYFGTIASYYPGYDYFSGAEAPFGIQTGIEDTANGNILSDGSYCFIPTEAAATRNVEMNYGDSEDKLLGSHAGWKIVPEYQSTDGYPITIRVAETSYTCDSGYVFGYGYASDSPSGNKCYYIKSNSVTVTADGKTYTADENGKITTPDAPANKEGYEFKGWSRTEGDTDPDNKLDFTSEVFDTDTEIYPIWVVVSSTVTVTADGKTYTADENGHITEPEKPAKKKGYGFKGWSRTEGDTDKNNKIDFATEVFTEDTTIYPIFTRNQYTVTYDTQGGSAIASQEYGDMAALNLPEGDALPTKAGFVFSHWALTPTGTAIDHHIIWVEEDMTVYAVWKKAGNPVKVTIGDTKDVFTTNDDGYLSAPKFNGNSFIYLGCSYTQYDRNYSNAIDFSTEVFTKDTTVYLIYPKVWFHVEGRNAGGIANLHALYPVRKDTHRIGSVPGAPDNKEGYEFKGWSLTEGDTDESNKLDLSTYEFSTTSDTDIYPIWVSTRSAVTVTADGKTYTADDQGKITRPDDPADKEGYWFKGWSRTENDTNPDNALDFRNEVFDSDTEIFPIWVKKVVVTADGKTYMVNEYGKISTPDSPAARDGYIFAGWSRTEGDTNPDNKINFRYTVFTSDTEIYPIWVQQFTVTADGKTYKINVEGKITTPLKPADKPDHIFAGWSRTENDTNIDNILDFGKEVFDTDTEIYPVWLTGVKVRVVDCLMKAKPWQMNCFHKADLYTVEERERTVETLSDGENKEYAAISFDGYKLLEDGWYWFVGGDDTVNWTDPNIKDNTKKTVVADYAGPAVVTLKFYYVDENMDYTIHDVFYTTDDEGKLIVQKDETRTGTYPFGSNLADNVDPLTDGAGNPPEGYYYFNKTDGTITDKPVLGYGDNFNYIDKNARYKITVKDCFGHIEQNAWGNDTFITDGEITRQVDSVLPGADYSYDRKAYDGWKEYSVSDGSGKAYYSKTVAFLYVSDGSGKPVPGGDVKDKVIVTADGKTYTADDNGHIRTPDKPASKPGYTFKGWSLTEDDTNPGNAIDFSKQVFTSNTEVYPIWVKAAVVIADGKPYTADENGHIKTPDYPADNPGYVFGGWSRTEGDTNPDNKLNFDKEVFDTDTEIYPIWVDAASVVKVTADGRIYAAGSKGHITTPVNPAPRPGYIFAGWSRTEGDTDPDNKLDFSNEVFDSDTEIFPIWVKEHTVTADGKDYKTDIDGHIPTPDRPADKEGYEFKGWSRTEGDTDPGNKIDFSNEVFTSDAEIYPIWVKVDSVVTVTADGKNYTADDNGHIRTPDAPASKPGYIFKGWSFIQGDTNPDNAIDFSKEVFTASTEIYPIWVAVNTGGSGSGSGSGSRSSSSGRSAYQELSGSWVHLEDGRWRFKLTDGSEIIGKWAYLKNPYAVTSLGQNEVDWFRFDDQGYMVTSWYTDTDGNIYYLHPVSDGSQGHMYTGWHWIEGADGLLRCYYFNTESDGTKGALYRSKTAPDGSIVDENGAWVIGDGAVTREAVKTAQEELTIAQNLTTRGILRSISRMFGLA